MLVSPWTLTWRRVRERSKIRLQESAVGDHAQMLGASARGRKSEEAHDPDQELGPLEARCKSSYSLCGPVLATLKCCSNQETLVGCSSEWPWVVTKSCPC